MVKHPVRRVTASHGGSSFVRDDNQYGNPENVNEAKRLINELEKHIVELSKVPLDDLPPGFKRRLANLRVATMRIGRHVKADRNLVEEIIQRSRGITDD